MMFFYSLKEAQVVVKRWQQEYNRVRPHSLLRYRPPAPATYRPNSLALKQPHALQ
jgi:transposase InsO family protein